MGISDALGAAVADALAVEGLDPTPGDWLGAGCWFLERTTIIGIVTQIAMMMTIKIDVYIMKRFRERNERGFSGGEYVPCGSYV